MDCLRKLDFTKQEWNSILENVEFTDEEIKIINFSRKGWFQIDIAEELNLGRRTIVRRCNKIKLKIAMYIALH